MIHVRILCGFCFQVVDGLNLGTITVDPRNNVVLIHYSYHFHRYDGKTPSVMMIWSGNEGASWHGPKNISQSIGPLLSILHVYFSIYRGV